MSQIQKIGLIACGGLLPRLVIDHLQKAKIPYCVVSFKGQPVPEKGLDDVEDHKQFTLGAVGKVLKFFKKNNVSHMMMAGFLGKANLFDVRPDFQGLKILASLTHKHDDALLTAICQFFEKHDIQNIGAHELLPEIVAQEGVYGKISPNKQQMESVVLAAHAAQKLGELDIGQSVVVKDSVVLGVEGVEGTDLLVERCAHLRGKKNQGGILVKSVKPHQNLNVDMPTIGVDTIDQLRKYNYEGLAISAGGALVLNVEEVVKAADNAGVFLVGISQGGNENTQKSSTS